MVVDYTFYVEEFLGDDIPSNLFNKYSEKAEYNVNLMIQNRTVESYFERQYKLAICEVADYYYQCDSDNKNLILNSESLGDYSVNYAITPYRDRDLAFSYLANTGLMCGAVICN